MDVQFAPLSEFDLERAADVLTRGFADYFVRIPFTPAALLQLARTDSVDFAASRVVARDGAPVGVMLIARRGWTSRLAGMAIVPEARRHGVGTQAMLQLLADARARGERAMTLEVIEQNEPAVRLYERSGFGKLRRLVGFEAAGGAATASPSRCEEIDPRTMAWDVAALPSDLPWQLAPETVAHLSPPTRAFRLSGASVAVTGIGSDDVAIRALAAAPHAGGQRAATDLLRTLRATFPAKRWQMKAIWPEELGAIFTDAGFTRTPLTQWQMVRSLA